MSQIYFEEQAGDEYLQILQDAEARLAHPRLSWNQTQDGDASPYISVIPIITAKARSEHGFDYEQVCSQLGGIVDELSAHTNPRQEIFLTHSDIFWLSELIYWERFFPNEKSAFPGVRAEVRDGASYPHCFFPVCLTCCHLELNEDDCPFVRFFPCPTGMHDPYKERVGYEKYGCPECLHDQLRAEEDLEKAESADLDKHHDKRQKLR